MAFRGVFIGIDRYRSPRAPWLTCAVRDAQALHALFTDTFGEGGELMIDEHATRQGIVDRLTALADARPDDVVVVSFSGHGSDTHELVSWDADPGNLASTALPLAELADLLGRIPARHVICFLDCCFSGGIGAKVLHGDVRSRDMRSTAELLDHLSGSGRVILTASAADEEAWEDRRRGHGFMTQYLLDGLMGAEEVTTGGKIGLYRLLEFVTRRVADAAQHLGKTQTPTLRGEIDGDVSWPVFQPGALYTALFPERVLARATADIASLHAFGFPQPVLDAWAGTIPTLNALQVDAINEFGVLAGENLLVSAPTSSGKTMVGELAALRGVLDRKRTAFLLPLKALVADKQRQFERLYGPLGVRTTVATGDSDDISDLLHGHYDIALLTYEKFSAIALAAPHVVEQLGVLVIDELQMIADKNRGANLEFLLTLIKVRIERGLPLQVIGLSAVIGDTNGLDRWLGARLLKRDQRPVPLDEGVLCGDGSWRYLDGVSAEERQTPAFIERQYRKNSSQDWLIPLTQRLVREGKQVIVFREQRGETVGCATYLANALGLPPATDLIDRLPRSDGTQGAAVVRATLHGGVAFHNSDLAPDVRQVLEEGFRVPDSRLRVIVATTTLAMGVNTPAGAVIVAGLNHPGPGRTTVPYSVAEYKNLVGRAGRLGVTDKGESYLLALTPMDEHRHWATYVRGRPEDVESRFLDGTTDIRALVLRVLATVPPTTPPTGMTAEELAQFLEASFGAYRQAQTAQNWRWNRPELLQAIENLRSHELIVALDGGVLALADLGRLAGEGGMSVESIIRLVDLLRDLAPEDMTDPTLITVAQVTEELDAMLFPINYKSTHKEPAFWSSELHKQGIPSQLVGALRRWSQSSHTGTLRAKKACACLLYVSRAPLGEIERQLTQFGGAFNGAAGPVRSVASRTSDVMTTVARVAQLLHPGLDLEERLERLTVRLEVGIPGDLVALARYAPTRLTREDYLALLSARLGTLDAIEAAADETVLPVLERSRTRVTLLRQAVRHERERIASLPSDPVGLPAYEA